MIYAYKCHLMTMCAFRCSSNNAWTVNRDSEEEQVVVSNFSIYLTFCGKAAVRVGQALPTAGRKEESLTADQFNGSVKWSY